MSVVIGIRRRKRPGEKPAGEREAFGFTKAAPRYTPMSGSAAAGPALPRMQELRFPAARNARSCATESAKPFTRPVRGAELSKAWVARTDASGGRNLI